MVQKSMPKVAPTTPIAARPVFGEISFPSPNVNKRPFDSPLASKLPQKSNADLKRMFEIGIKLSTDNKINASNSWEINLIDFFSDMNVLKDGDSINFQKASYTLEGCVKIYTNRMNSVDSDTKRLLCQLADSNDTEGDIEGPKKKKRVITSGNTLEADFSALNFKKLDLEFEVDPLFKKTSADFDEGGAQGLLLNHLCVGKNGQVIFDASNVPGTEDGKADTVSSAPLDIRKLKDIFQASFQSLWSRDLCPSLKKFEFSSSDTASNLFNPQSYMDSAQDMFSYSATYTGDPEDDDMDQQPGHCSDDNDGHDGYAHQAGFGDAQDIESNDTNAIPLILTEMQNVLVTDDLENIEGEIGLAQRGIEAFSFFDASANKNWIGPEHWRPSRFTAVKKSLEEKKERQPKKKRVAPAGMDFNASPVDLDVLCEVGKTSINLPKASYKSKNQLPEKDCNFTADKMVSLFIRPKYKMVWKKLDGTTRKQVHVATQAEVEQPNVVPDISEGNQLDPDVAFWVERQDELPTFEEALAPVEQVADEEVRAYYGSDSDDEDDNLSEISQLASTIGGISLDFGDQLVDAPKRTAAHQLNYSRVAKKVDVKRLKDNMWKSVTTAVETEDENVPGCKFTEVVHGLGEFYPEKKMRDISVAFCFICLLHLANEVGLEIKMDRDTACGVEAKGMDELVIQVPLSQQ